MDLTAKDERFLQMAMGVASTSECRMKHGAIVLRHGKILGSSPNIYKNNPRNVNWKSCHVHAEVAAMKRANWPTKVTVYVARINNSGTEPRLSKPCINCEEVLKAYKAKVIWTVNGIS